MTITIESGITIGSGISFTTKSIVTDNLLVYIDANNPNSYSGTGTSVTDLSGNGYTHTLSNAAQFGVVGGAKCFNCSTTSSYVITNNNSLLPVLPTSGYTYSVWARVMSSSTYRSLIRCFPNSTGNFPIIINSGTSLLGYWDNATSTGFNSSTYTMSSLVNTWAMWSVTGTNTSQSFFINGQPVGSSVSKGAGGQVHKFIGNANSGGQPFGYVAQCMLYSTILTNAQILQNFDVQRSIFGV